MTLVKHIAVFCLGMIPVLYLLNLDAGIIELIPDDIPIVGNLNETAATLLLLNCLAYFGLDLRRLPRPTSRTKETDNINKVSQQCAAVNIPPAGLRAVGSRLASRLTVAQFSSL